MLRKAQNGTLKMGDYQLKRCFSGIKIDDTKRLMLSYPLTNIIPKHEASWMHKCLAHLKKPGTPQSGVILSVLYLLSANTCLYAAESHVVVQTVIRTPPPQLSNQKFNNTVNTPSLGTSSFSALSAHPPVLSPLQMGFSQNATQGIQMQHLSLVGLDSQALSTRIIMNGLNGSNSIPEMLQTVNAGVNAGVVQTDIANANRQTLVSESASKINSNSELNRNGNVKAQSSKNQTVHGVVRFSKYNHHGSVVAKELQVPKGSVFVAYDEPVIIRTHYGKVRIAAGAAVFIVHVKNTLCVYNLSDKARGDIAIKTGGKWFPVDVARLVVIARTPNGENLDFADADPLPTIAWRNDRCIWDSRHWKTFEAEFSHLSALSDIYQFNELLRSGREGDKKIAERVMKTAAAVATLNPWEVNPAPTTAAQNPQQEHKPGATEAGIEKGVAEGIEKAGKHRVEKHGKQQVENLDAKAKKQARKQRNSQDTETAADQLSEQSAAEFNIEQPVGQVKKVKGAAPENSIKTFSSE